MRLQKGQFAFLKEVQEVAELNSNSKYAEAVLSIEGLHGESCIWLVEQLFLKQKGAYSFSIEASGRQIHLWWIKGKFILEAYGEHLYTLGYELVRPLTQKIFEDSHLLLGSAFVSTTLTLMAFACSLPLYGAMKIGEDFETLVELILILCGTLNFTVSGGALLHGYQRKLLSAMQTAPAGLALCIGYGMCFYGWIAPNDLFFRFELFSLMSSVILWGRRLEIYFGNLFSEEMSRENIFPDHFEYINSDGSTEIKPIDALSLRDHFFVPPEGMIPVDARLLAGDVVLDKTYLGHTGPSLYKAGHVLPAGSVNSGSIPIELQALESWEASFLQKLVLGLPSGSSLTHFTERIIVVLTLCYALFGTLLKSLLGGSPLATCLTLLALLLLPSEISFSRARTWALRLALLRLASHGIYLREHIFDRLRKVDAIAETSTPSLFDQVDLANPGVLEMLSRSQRSILLHLLRKNVSPMALALKEAVRELPCDLLELDFVAKETPGMGFSGEFDGKIWSIGLLGWRAGISPSTVEVLNPEDLEFACNGRMICIFCFYQSMAPGMLTINNKLREEYHLSRVAEVKASRPHCLYLDKEPRHLLHKTSLQGILLHSPYELSITSAHLFFRGHTAHMLPALFHISRACQHLMLELRLWLVLYFSAGFAFFTVVDISPIWAAVFYPFGSLLTFALFRRRFLEKEKLV